MSHCTAMPDSQSQPLYMQTGSKGKGDKENRPKVARAKGEKRAKRTSKALAGSQAIDLVVGHCSALSSAAYTTVNM